MSAPTIQFTQEQARSVVGLSPGDLRHWRKAIPYLASKVGKAARFTFADLIVLALIREVVTTFGVQISAVGKGVDKAFHLLDDHGSAQLKGACFALRADDIDLVRGSELATQFPTATLVVPCEPLVTRVANHVLPASLPRGQTSLPFPPKVLRSGA